ncbi:MAG: TetR/AcrR family transcriptional regulator [Acidimicrobiales bacterium]
MGAGEVAERGESREDAVADGSVLDGRSAIRDRNRNAVLDAVIDLFSEDNLSPGPEEVALRAGLSVRSVYRYFDDHDSLSRAAVARQLEMVTPLFLIPAIGEGDRDMRIDKFVRARLRLHAAVAPSARATRMRARFDDVVRDEFEASRILLREQIERHFAREFAAFSPERMEARLAAVDALFAFESLDHYVLHRTDLAAVVPLLVDALDALLRP